MHNLWLGRKLLGCRLMNDLATLHEVEAVRELERSAQVLLDEQNRDSALCDIFFRLAVQRLCIPTAFARNSIAWDERQISCWQSNRILDNPRRKPSAGFLPANE